MSMTWAECSTAEASPIMTSYYDSCTSSNDSSHWHTIDNSSTSTVDTHYYEMADHQYIDPPWASDSLSNQRLEPYTKPVSVTPTEWEKKAAKLVEELANQDLLDMRENKTPLLISRRGKNYEILPDGKVNRILRSGRKVGLCFDAIGDTLPVDDVLLLKYLLIKNCSVMIEKIANEVTPFVYTS